MGDSLLRALSFGLAFAVSQLAFAAEGEVSGGDKSPPSRVVYSSPVKSIQLRCNGGIGSSVHTTDGLYTANHVVRGCSSVVIDGVRREVVWRDSALDLALIDLPGGELEVECRTDWWEKGRVFDSITRQGTVKASVEKLTYIELDRGLILVNSPNIKGHSGSGLVLDGKVYAVLIRANTKNLGRSYYKPFFNSTTVCPGFYDPLSGLGAD